LLVAFGEQRERYKSAADIQKYSGIAPVTERSGQKHWVHWRLQCPTFMRQTFVEWAGQTINKSYWAGAYYRQQRDKGSTHQAAVRSLAFKWIRILYRCWQTGEAYDESRYLKALERRGFMSQPAQKSELGFIPGLPTTFLISPKGNVVARQVGLVTRKMIEMFIQKWRAQ